MLEKISANELKNKLDQGEPIQLVAALDQYEYLAGHIPGSIYFENPREAASSLDKNAEIVVYCSGPSCASGPVAAQYFMRSGFEKVRLYSGGLEQWDEAGFPLEKSRGF
jgi:rhodanese-related sulfurtransferase